MFIGIWWHGAYICQNLKWIHFIVKTFYLNVIDASKFGQKQENVSMYYPLANGNVCFCWALKNGHI